MARTLLGHETVVRPLAALADVRALAVLAALAGLAALPGVAGCGAVERSSPEPERAFPVAIEERAPPPMWEKEAPPAVTCEEPAPLLVHHDGAGHVDRLHARLTALGALGDFLVDTGSLRSYVTEPGAGDETTSTSVVLFCRTKKLPIIARLRPGTTPDGQPQAGVLGSDLLANGAVLDLDLAKRQLSWYQPAPAPPAGAVVLPIEYRNGWLIASGIKVDGREVKLVVDTGASNVILFDKTPRPNEVREETVDGTASPIVLFHGTGTVSFGGGEARPVPVDRTDAFPTLEGLIAQLGGDVAGLLGLTSLGRERIVIGKESLVVMLPPIAPSPD